MSRAVVRSVAVVVCSAAIGAAVTGVPPSAATTAPPDGAAPVPGAVTRVSVASDESQLSAARIPYGRTVTSGDGRFVVFQSREPLTPADTNDAEDVFRRDLATGVTLLVSAAPDGTATSGSGASVSDDGRYVAFASSSSALTADDHNGGRVDVFVRDMLTGAVVLASQSTEGEQRRADVFDAPVISGDGSRVAFVTPARLHRSDRDTAPRPWRRRLDAYVRTLATERTRLVSVGTRGRSFRGTVTLGGISDDGRLIGFTRGSTERHTSDEPSGFYLRRMGSPRSVLVWRDDVNALRGFYEGSPALSGDGRYVAFASNSSRLDREPGFPRFDVGRITRSTGRLAVASVAPGGADADADSWAPSLSATGHRLAFASEASNLVPSDDNDVVDAFLTSFPGRVATLVSATPGGGAGNASSGFGGAVSLSGDGRHVAFGSFAGDLVPGDDNADQDVFEWSSTEVGQRRE